jgi:hypothetical protein
LRRQAVVIATIRSKLFHLIDFLTFKAKYRNPMKAKQSSILNEVRTLLETLMRTEDNAKVGSLKEFIRGTHERVVAEMKPKVKLAKADQYPEYNEFIDIWDSTYHGLLDMPMDGKKIKSLIAKTKQYIYSAGGEVSSEHAINFWKVFVSNLTKHPFYNGKGLSIIDSKYFELIYEMKNGKKKSTSRATDARSFIDGM